MAKKKSSKQVDTIIHDEAKRKNIPTAEYRSVLEEREKDPIQVAYERRNPDLDPQLVWRGKDVRDWSDLVVQAPPLYIQEKVHPKVLIDDLMRRTEAREEANEEQPDLFSDFNGVPEGEAKTEFYQHDANWSNRMILGDALHVMASLAEREGMRGKVQCIYIDPPYGITFNSNFQWSTTTRDVEDKKEHITREPEQVKAFRDTWRDGIHSYLTYLRDRLTVARDLLSESGSVFVQIGSGNVHRVRALMDEVFGSENLVTEIVVKKKGSQKSSMLDPVNDFILWYSKSPRSGGGPKFRALYESRSIDADTIDEFSRIELPNGRVESLKRYTTPDGESLDFRLYPKRIDVEFPGGRLFRPWPITNGGSRVNQMDPVEVQGRTFTPPTGNCWRHTSRAVGDGLSGMDRIRAADRLLPAKTSLDFKRYLDDFPYTAISNWWDGFGGAPDQVYVVQTNERIVERCILLTTDPGDLVLDPTCGSGTTATVAEKWGRRWITIDTSRVALALARARIMGSRYPYYLLRDSSEGKKKEAELARSEPSTGATYGRVRQGFVYRRCAYVTSGVIANDAEIDVIVGAFRRKERPLREHLNTMLGETWEEWEVPRKAEERWPEDAKSTHADWRKVLGARQEEIEASINAKADFEYLYDQPYRDRSKVRVAGPFTVESLSPHRSVGLNEKDELVDRVRDAALDAKPLPDFASMVLENLRRAGVQQAHKDDKIVFASLDPWPGRMVCADGRYVEGDEETGAQRRAAILVGPEFGTVTRPDLVEAAREAADAGFDVLVSCAFSYEAHASDFEKLGKIPVLKARMNADLHMADDLKATGKGNLFVIFGEPDIDVFSAEDGDGQGGQLQVRINGVDVFHPSTGEVKSDGPEGIACWFLDTDYNEESFFVRHAYFLGQNDPYKSLKTTLKAEIDKAAWSSLRRATSRPFDKPASGRIAVKVINHLGDEVMKVFRVD